MSQQSFIDCTPPRQLHRWIVRPHNCRHRHALELRTTNKAFLFKQCGSSIVVGARIRMDETMCSANSGSARAVHDHADLGDPRSSSMMVRTPAVGTSALPALSLLSRTCCGGVTVRVGFASSLRPLHALGRPPAITSVRPVLTPVTCHVPSWMGRLRELLRPEVSASPCVAE